MKKEYQFNSVKYGFSLPHRKWVFTDGGAYTLISSVKGGAETAHKVAHVVNAGLSRTKGKGIDNLARANIAKLVA